MVYGAGAAAAAAVIVTLALTVAEMAGDARVVRAIIANAMKASGAIVRVKPDAFEKIIARIDEPLVVRAKGGWRIKNYQYLTAYRGLIFYTKSPSEILFQSRVEMVSAAKIWIPD
ncbi:MAG: hypothetical protein DDT28_00874 [Dehalococcoidia bacterium]|nr:hypothetical protein [Chloroflexota bacterium]